MQHCFYYRCQQGYAFITFCLVLSVSKITQKMWIQFHEFFGRQALDKQQSLRQLRIQEIRFFFTNLLQHVKYCYFTIICQVSALQWRAGFQQCKITSNFYCILPVSPYPRLPTSTHTITVWQIITICTSWKRPQGRPGETWTWTVAEACQHGPAYHVAVNTRSSWVEELHLDSNIPQAAYACCWWMALVISAKAFSISTFKHTFKIKLFDIAYLHSASALLPHQPPASTVFSSRAFPVAAPTVWNSLHINTRSAETLLTFRSRLKTELFLAS